jgi:hypothetical protein
MITAELDLRLLFLALRLGLFEAGFGVEHGFYTLQLQSLFVTSQHS